MKRATAGGEWFWKRLRWMEPQYFLQPGPGSLHSLGPKEPMFLSETAGDKAESQGQLRRGIEYYLPQSGLEARQSWTESETPTPNLFCQPLAFSERWRGAELETRASACYSQT